MRFLLLPADPAAGFTFLVFLSINQGHSTSKCESAGTLVPVLRHARSARENTRNTKKINKTTYITVISVISVFTDFYWYFLAPWERVCLIFWGIAGGRGGGTTISPRPQHRWVALYSWPQAFGVASTRAGCALRKPHGLALFSVIMGLWGFAAHTCSIR